MTHQKSGLTEGKTNARKVLADILAEEIGINPTDGFLRAIDRILAKLWIEGYVIKPHLEEVDGPA